MALLFEAQAQAGIDSFVPVVPGGDEPDSGPTAVDFDFSQLAAFESKMYPKLAVSTTGPEPEPRTPVSAKFRLGSQTWDNILTYLNDPVGADRQVEAPPTPGLRIETGAHHNDELSVFEALSPRVLYSTTDTLSTAVPSISNPTSPAVAEPPAVLAVDSSAPRSPQALSSGDARGAAQTSAPQHTQQGTRASTRPHRKSLLAREAEASAAEERAALGRKSPGVAAAGRAGKKPRQPRRDTAARSRRGGAADKLTPAGPYGGSGLLPVNHKPARGRGRSLQLSAMSEAEKQAEAEVRLERNRQAARDFRLRRKHHVDGLERQVAEYERRDREQVQLIAELQAEMARIRERLRLEGGRTDL